MISLAVVLRCNRLSKVNQVVKSRLYLDVLCNVELVNGIVVVLVSQQGIDRVYTILVVPVQLLLECVVLVSVVATTATTVVTLTIADYRALVDALLVVAKVKVTLQCEGEVIWQQDVGISNTVDGVADGLVLIQLVLPDNVAVGILVAGYYNLTVGIDIRTAVVLAIALLVEQILTCVHIVSVNRIYGRNLATVVEGVIVGVTSAIA